MDVKADSKTTAYITFHVQDYQANKLYSPSEKTKSLYNMAKSEPKSSSSQPSSRTSVDRDLDVMRKDYLGLLCVKEGPKVKSELGNFPDCHQQGFECRDMTMMHEGQIKREPSVVREDPESSGVSGAEPSSGLNEETLNYDSIKTERPEPMNDRENEIMQNKTNSRSPNTGMLDPDPNQPHKLDHGQLKSFEVVKIKMELPVPLQGLEGEKGLKIVPYSLTGNSKKGLSRNCSMEFDETDARFGENGEAVQDINQNWKRTKFTERSPERSKSFYAPSERLPRPLPGRRQPSRAAKLIEKRSSAGDTYYPWTSEEDDLDLDSSCSSWEEEKQNSQVKRLVLPQNIQCSRCNKSVPVDDSGGCPCFGDSISTDPRSPPIGGKTTNYDRHKPRYQCSICERICSSACDLETHYGSHKNKNPKVYKNKRIRLQSRYGCLTCGGKFVKLSDMKEHIGTHDGHKPRYECTRCGKVWRSSNELNTHIMVSHQEGNDIHCKKCDFPLLGPENIRLTYTHKKEIQTNKTHKKAKKPKSRYGCITCGKKFAHIGVIKEHLSTNKTHRAKNQCNICGKIVEMSGLLAKHMGKHEDGTLFQCDKCGYSTLSLDPYKSHSCAKPPKVENVVQYKRPYGCMTCGEVFLKQISMEYHMLEYPGHKPRNQCIICGKVFLRLSNLRTHVENHETYQCDQCSYTCDTPSLLSRHILTHNAVYDKPCPTCGHLFKDNASLRRHIKVVHTGTREFLCFVCGKAFKQKHCLLRHMIVHADDRPFSCPICCKSFKNKTALSWHVKRHERKEKQPELQHQCSTCGKRFHRRDTLIAHMACHRDDMPFECEYCGKKFKRIQNLNSHTRTHVDKRDFKCDVCGQEFKWKHILQNHLKKHNR